MNYSKCRTCKHYDLFFDACELYTEEIYLGEGDYDDKPVRIKNISEDECEYEQKVDNND